jgi:predicted GTPase
VLSEKRGQRGKTQPGRGVIPRQPIEQRVRDAADHLFEHADAVYIVVAKIGGGSDNDELVFSTSRGSGLAMLGAMVKVDEFNAKNARVCVDEVDDDEDE